MNKQKLSAEKGDFILRNAPLFTIKELAEAVQLSEVKVSLFCKQNNLVPKPPVSKSVIQNNKSAGTSGKYQHQGYKNWSEDEVKKPVIRPPANYTNIPSPFGIASDKNKSQQ